MKNPLNDEDYTGNDEQIEDLKELVSELAEALKNLFELHEPEGRFQPSHYKPILAAAQKALAKVKE